jgi:transposase InsO family protein
MNDTATDLRHAIALFRYGLIADLVHLPPGTQGLYQQLEAKAAKAYTIPGTHRTRVAAETLRDWLRAYRQGGFDALLPKPRADRGEPRRLPATVVERLLSIKEANLSLSVRQVIAQARTDGEIPAEVALPRSTVHRLLARHGLMRKRAEQPGDLDRRRFAFAHAGQLWMSDVMHGPSVLVAGRQRRKTYLIAFLDDATRVVPAAAFALAENTRAFLPVLKQALLRRGYCERLYVDNGANYRSRHLGLVCAKLGIALIHARPYRPQGKGKIERFFRTLRAQLLTRLSPQDTASLEALNRRLWGWVEGEYHHSPHRGLDGLTPLERWAQTAQQVRFPEPELDLDALFLFEAIRKVAKDRTVSLNGTLYEVDAALIGERVTLRYDPSAPSGRPIEVCHADNTRQLAKPVDAYANCFVKRHRPSWTLSTEAPAPEPSPSRIALRHLTEADDDTQEDR